MSIVPWLCECVCACEYVLICVYVLFLCVCVRQIGKHVRR